MALSIRNNVALVTGASRGIGELSAMALAAEGCHVALVARSERRLEQVAAACEKHGVRALALPADLTDMSVIGALVERCVAELGGLNILVANAGVYHHATAYEADLAQWDSMLDLNLRGAMHLTRHALPHILRGVKPAGHGAVIYVASMSGIRTYTGGAGYCATKFGIVGFASAVWDDVAELGVKVSAICPGFTNTEMSAHDGLNVRMMIQPQDVAGLVRMVATWPDTSCPRLLQVAPQRVPRPV